MLTYTHPNCLLSFLPDEWDDLPHFPGVVVVSISEHDGTACGSCALRLHCPRSLDVSGGTRGSHVWALSSAHSSGLTSPPVWRLCRLLPNPRAGLGDCVEDKWCAWASCAALTHGGAFGVPPLSMRSQAWDRMGASLRGRRGYVTVGLAQVCPQVWGQRECVPLGSVRVSPSVGSCYFVAHWLLSRGGSLPGTACAQCPESGFPWLAVAGRRSTLSPGLG